MDSSNSAATNAMNILQQFSQLLFLQSLATAGKTSSMDPSIFGFPKLEPQEQQSSSSFPTFPSSPTQVTSTLPPISPQGNASINPLQTISELLASHQSLKSDLSSSPALSETSPFKMYNNSGMDLSWTSSSTRQYKVHVNRESSKPLQEWMNQHITDPYPTHRDVQQLSKQTGFTFKQIRNWFTNSRRRYEHQCGTNPLPWNKKDAPKVCRKILPSESSSESCESP
uniref:Homeobox domain-containing protein n=1 Tax=Panagrolaimus superbus TaxID=310955 RepID=A0A914XTP4_9BILA